MRREHKWLIGSIDTRLTERLLGEIRDRSSIMTLVQMSEAVHPIVALHDVLRSYQLAMVPARQMQAACRALRAKEGQPQQDPSTCAECKLFLYSSRHRYAHTSAGGLSTFASPPHSCWQHGDTLEHLHPGSNNL